MIRAVVADDHPHVLRGVREALDEAPDVETVGEAAGGEALLALVRALGDGVDVVVTDLTMPGVGGIEVVLRLAAERPGLPVLVLSAHGARELGVQVLEAGGAGYVEKSAAADVLAEAVRRVARGGRYVGADLAEELADRALGGARRLSPREAQVVRAIGRGMTRDEAARELAVSPSTVSTYRRRALRKLRLVTDADLARYAVRHGLVD